MKINYDKANEKITDWSTDVLGQLKSEIDAQGIRHVTWSKSPKAARDSLTRTTRKNDGMINRVSYKIPKHMIFVHKGVGKGTTIDQVGSTKRKAKPWFNPVIERNIEKLADIAAEEMGSGIINNLLIN